MAEYRKKPIFIQATQFNAPGDHHAVRAARRKEEQGWEDPCEHCGAALGRHGRIETRQGEHAVCPGDFIIAELDGNGFYPCKPDIFAKSYDAVGPVTRSDGCTHASATALAEQGLERLRLALGFCAGVYRSAVRDPNAWTQNFKNRKRFAQVSEMLSLVHELLLHSIDDAENERQDQQARRDISRLRS